jgi:hypothetical protein
MSEEDWRKARPFLVWAILAVLFLAIFAFVLKQSESYGTCVHEKKAYYAQEQFQENDWRFVSVMDRRSRAYITCFWEFAEDNDGAFVAIGTIFLALFTLALWVATRALVRGAENTAVRQLRAYVFVRPDQVHVNLEKSEIGIQYEKINAGQTPAYDVINIGEMRIMPWPLPDDFAVIPIDEKDANKHRDAPIGPKRRGMFSEATMEYSPLKGNERYYLLVIIRYRDAFNRRRTTRFCCSTDISELLAGARPGVDRKTEAQRFDSTAQHNDAD